MSLKTQKCCICGKEFEIDSCHLTTTCIECRPIADEIRSKRNRGEEFRPDVELLFWVKCPICEKWHSRDPLDKCHRTTCSDECKLEYKLMALQDSAISRNPDVFVIVKDSVFARPNSFTEGDLLRRTTIVTDVCVATKYRRAKNMPTKLKRDISLMLRYFGYVTDGSRQTLRMRYEKNRDRYHKEMIL